jgi:hypothetical protein
MYHSAFDYNAVFHHVADRKKKKKNKLAVRRTAHWHGSRAKDRKKRTLSSNVPN